MIWKTNKQNWLKVKCYKVSGGCRVGPDQHLDILLLELAGRGVWSLTNSTDDVIPQVLQVTAELYALKTNQANWPGFWYNLSFFLPQARIFVGGGYVKYNFEIKKSRATQFWWPHQKFIMAKNTDSVL